MHCLQHVFQRGALALGLLAAGIGGGYGLYQPDTTASNCRDAIARPASMSTIGDTGYVEVRTGDSASPSTDQAACNCGSA